MALADTGAVGLLFRIKADSSQASRELRQFKTEVKTETAQAADAGTSGADAVGASVGGMTTAIVAGVAVVGALAAAAAAAGKALLDMAKDAAAAGAEIDEVNKLTGLGAERISALRLVAQGAGKDFDSISGALTSFTELLAKAAQGSAEAKERIQRFGLDPQKAISDLDGALKTVVEQIFNLENPLDRAAAATLAFGNRGKDLLPVIAAVGGDFSRVTVLAEEFGVVLGEDDVRAAERFTRQSNELNAQLNSLKQTIGTELLPVLNDLFTDLSEWLKENKEEWRDWGRFIADTIRVTAVSLRALLTGAGASAAALRAISSLEGSRQPRSLSDVNFQPVDIGKFIRGGGDTPDLSDLRAKEAARKRALAESRKALQESEANLRDALRNLDTISQNSLAKLDITLKNSLRIIEELYDKGAFSAADFKERSLAALELWSDGVAKIINAVYAGRIAAARGNEDELGVIANDLGLKQLRLSEAFAAKQREIEERLAKDRAEIAKEGARENDDVIRALSKLRAEKAKEDEQILRDYVKYLDDVAAALQSVRDVEQDRLRISRAIEDAANDRKERELEGAIGAANSPSARDRALNDLREFLEAKARIERDRELEDIRIEEEQAIARLTELERELGLEEELRALYRERRLLSEEEFEEKLREIRGRARGGKSFSEDLIEQLEAAGEAFENFGDVMESVRGIAARVFASFASGIGDAVEQWVLYGKTSGAVLKKVLAQTLAQIAAEAAVRAVYATALGFLRLAQWDFAGAANAFTSAGIWASIAVGTALAGRAIAGDSFSRETGAGAGTTSGSNAQGGTTQPDTQVVDIGRNAPGQRPVEIQVSGDFAEFFEFKVMENGRVRNVLRGV